jgi:hypothetical protein
MNVKPPSRRFIDRVRTAIPTDADPVDLYCLFNQIAVVRYNEGQGSGYLSLCPDQRESLMRLDAAMPLDNARGVRKMLQMTSPNLSAMCDGRVIYGLDYPSTDFLVVRFQWPGTWYLTKDTKTLMRTAVRSEIEELDIFRKDFFYTALELVFGSLPKANQKRLYNLVLSATRQKNGTNVLMSANAAAEVTRLNSQCTKLKPFELTPPILEQISSIDGTVVIDPSGRCHAVGAILDGARSARGDRARGGRYNSALMYVDSSPFACMILVVSKDGMVDLVYRQPGPFLADVQAPTEGRVALSSPGCNQRPTPVTCSSKRR